MLHQEGSWLSTQAAVWKTRNWERRPASHTISWSSLQAKPILAAPGFMSEEKWKAKYSWLSRHFLNTYLVHGNPLQSSCLENPMDRGVWWALVSMGVTKGWTWLKRLCTHTQTHTLCQDLAVHRCNQCSQSGADWWNCQGCTTQGLEDLGRVLGIHSQRSWKPWRSSKS